MTAKERESLLQFVEEWQRRFRLADWDIGVVLHDGDELPRELAEGECWRGASSGAAEDLEGRIDLAVDDEQYGPRNVARHELLHFVLLPIVHAAARLRDHVSPAVWNLVLDEMQEETELAIERINGAIDELEPTLPEEG